MMKKRALAAGHPQEEVPEGSGSPAADAIVVASQHERIYKAMTGDNDPGEETGLSSSALYFMEKFRKANGLDVAEGNETDADKIGATSASGKAEDAAKGLSDIERMEKERGFLPGEWSPLNLGNNTPDGWRPIPGTGLALLTSCTAGEAILYDTGTLRPLRTFHLGNRLDNACYVMINPQYRVSVIRYGEIETLIYSFDLPGFSWVSDWALCRIK
jgi:hypothetical protein